MTLGCPIEKTETQAAIANENYATIKRERKAALTDLSLHRCVFPREIVQRCAHRSVFLRENVHMCVFLSEKGVSSMQAAAATEKFVAIKGERDEALLAAEEAREVPTSCIQHPKPYTLHISPYTLPTPYTLHSTP